VLVLGDHGTGKTALLQQFLTSEYMGAATQADTVFDDDSDIPVTVMLDGEETTMDFTEVPYEENLANYGDVDAYVVVFAINDYGTFQSAGELLHDIRTHDSGNTGILLVGNKSELVRSRQVSEDEAMSICNECKAKYVELSAALNHKVDELLVGVARQIHLNAKRESKNKKGRNREGSIVVRSAKGLMGKLFVKKQVMTKSCENLSVL